MANHYDVIIVGGGFAGLTTARQLNNEGYKTLILEGRDRLGGRTWYEERMGRKLELGGTWVHWFQPHVWAEITRYGLETTHSPIPEEAYWIADNKLESGTPDDLFALIGEGMEYFSEQCRDYFPNPYEPLSGENIKEIDHLTVADKINELQLNPRVHDLVYSMWALNFNGYPDKGGYTQALRWLALSNNDWELCLEICAFFKLKHGTKALINSIASDVTGDIVTGKTVGKVEKNSDGYSVVTKDQEVYKAGSVVVTLPLNILNSIEFSPSLSEPKQKAGGEGQTSSGVKLWAKIRNWSKPFVAFAPADYPLNYIQYEYQAGEDAILLGFGPDAGRLNPENREEVEKAVRYWIPEAEIIESEGHDWVSDEFAGETWPMQQRNQLTEYLAELQRPEDGLFLAGSDYADGWAGFMDGAIESGFKVSNKVHSYLKDSQSLTKEG
ncbi:flavin monoamine oxidase family protein [Salibacterium sp. K-3]